MSRVICDWQDIGRELEVSEEDLIEIQLYAPGRQKGKANEMLQKWKQQSGRNATYKRLGEALIRCGRKDLQEALEEEGIL